MSIRLKLGLEDDEFTDKTRIIIVKMLIPLMNFRSKVS